MQRALPDYQICPPDIVKSVRQRWLFTYWTRLRAERPLPLWSDLDMAELESCFDDLSFLDVFVDKGAMRLRIHNHGKNVGAMYASQCAGKFLDELLPEAARAPTLETYEQAVRVRLPVYTVSRLADADARVVLYERLLLPFSDFGERVFRILASLETISPVGAFERHKLMSEPRSATSFAIKAALRAGPGIPNIVRNSASAK
jgi:hypothetical protein